MQTKLTLRLESDLIEEAKNYAAKSGKSLSKMVAEYFYFLTSKNKIVNTEQLPPVTSQLKGVIRGQSVKKDDYFKHLEKKYL